MAEKKMIEALADRLDSPWPRVCMVFLTILSAGVAFSAASRADDAATESAAATDRIEAALATVDAEVENVREGSENLATVVDSVEGQARAIESTVDAVLKAFTVEIVDAIPLWEQEMVLTASSASATDDTPVVVRSVKIERLATEMYSRDEYDFYVSSSPDAVEPGFRLAGVAIDDELHLNGVRIDCPTNHTNTACYNEPIDTGGLRQGDSLTEAVAMADPLILNFVPTPEKYNLLELVDFGLNTGSTALYLVVVRR